MVASRHYFKSRGYGRTPLWFPPNVSSVPANNICADIRVRRSPPPPRRWHGDNSNNPEGGRRRRRRISLRPVETIKCKCEREPRIVRRVHAAGRSVKVEHFHLGGGDDQSGTQRSTSLLEKRRRRARVRRNAALAREPRSPSDTNLAKH